MRICCLSDTHGGLPKIHDCDLVLVAGDICPHNTNFSLFRTLEEAIFQRNWLRYSFLKWVRNLEKEGKQVFFIAGNHDFGLSHFPEMGNPSYLQDSSGKIKGTKKTIYGTPWQPWFWDWAFNAPRFDKEERFLTTQFSLITKCDILLCHGPPHGILDKTNKGEHVGSKALLKRIQEIKPKLVVFGHIHEQGGEQVTIDGTTYVNAAVANERNVAIRSPLYLEIDL